jgi:hypothetical protein
VVDGTGKNELSLPSGRDALLQRVEALVNVEAGTRAAPQGDPYHRLRSGILSRWGDQLDLMAVYGSRGRQTLLVVADQHNSVLRSDLAGQLGLLFSGQPPQLKLLDRNTYATIRELLEAGVLNSDEINTRVLYCSKSASSSIDDGQSARLDEARQHLATGERKWRMAKVLADSGFALEALVPMREAVDISLQALLLWQGHDIETPASPELIEPVLVQAKLLPSNTISQITLLHDESSEPDVVHAENLLEQSNKIWMRAASALGTS